MGHFSANSSSHTFLLEFLQFVVTLVDTVVYSTGIIDIVVKWNVDVALSHVTDHMYNSMHRKHYGITTSVFTLSILRTVTQFWAIHENYGYSLKALWVVCESIRGRNYRLKKRIIYLGLMTIPQLTLWMQCHPTEHYMLITRLPFVLQVYCQVCSLTLPQVTQLICVGGSAGCDYGIQLRVIQCHNWGFDGYNMQVKGKSCQCVWSPQLHNLSYWYSKDMWNKISSERWGNITGSIIVIWDTQTSFLMDILYLLGGCSYKNSYVATEVTMHT